MLIDLPWSLVADQTDEYFVYVNWTAHPNRASNAQYKITTPAGIQYADVNQQTSADGWHLLNTVSLNSGDSVVVELTDVANGYVIADAVKMISTTAPPNSVTWELPITGQATYEVYARWTSHPNRADNAEYVIQHAMGEASIVVNQRANSAQWNYLGTYDLNGASSVTISDVANGYVIADAIELRRVSAVSAFEPFAIHTDHLDAPRRVTDAANDEVWAASRLPFGKISVTTEELTLNLRFPGQYFDQETGTHYNYFRDYDPGIGRYVQSDPIGLYGGPNTYNYVGGNSVNYFDPLGLAKLPDNPGGLGDGWSQDHGHRNPNGEKWNHDSGTSVEWHPGQPGKPGWGGKDHWHVDGGKKHLPPGTDVPGFPGNDESDDGGQCGEDSTCRTVAATIVVGGTAYVVYRCVRMVPSLFPPLWPTIPANAAIP